MTDAGPLRALRDENAVLVRRVAQLEEELKAFGHTEDILQADARQLEETVAKLRYDKDMLYLELRDVKQERAKKVAELEGRLTSASGQADGERAQLLRLSQLESEVHDAVAEKLKQELEAAYAYIRHLKNVMTIPRLNRAFQELRAKLASQE